MIACYGGARLPSSFLQHAKVNYHTILDYPTYPWIAVNIYPSGDNGEDLGSERNLLQRALQAR